MGWEHKGTSELSRMWSWGMHTGEGSKEACYGFMLENLYFLGGDLWEGCFSGNLPSVWHAETGLFFYPLDL